MASMMPGVVSGSKLKRDASFEHRHEVSQFLWSVVTGVAGLIK